MALFRALINNTFFILLLLVAATLYIAFSDSIKKDHGIPVETRQVAHQTVSKNAQDATEHKVKQQAEQLAEQSKEEVGSTEVVGTSNTEASDETTGEKDSSTANMSNAVAEPSMLSKLVPSSESKATEETSNPTQVTEAVKKPSAIQKDQTAAEEEHTPLESKQTKTTATEQPATTETSQKPNIASSLYSKEEVKEVLSQYPSPQAALTAAEEAYKKQDLAKAEKILFGLTLLNPNPNLLGSLGNVFYKDGKLDWAKRAWAAAADQLIKRGEVAKASKYAEQLKSVAPDLSKKIMVRVNKKLSQK